MRSLLILTQIKYRHHLRNLFLVDLYTTLGFVLYNFSIKFIVLRSIVLVIPFSLLSNMINQKYDSGPRSGSSRASNGTPNRPSGTTRLQTSKSQCNLRGEAEVAFFSHRFQSSMNWFWIYVYIYICIYYSFFRKMYVGQFVANCLSFLEICCLSNVASVFA